MHSAVSQSCENGKVEIFGIVTDTLIAGRLEYCFEGEWFAVYDMRWGNREAGLVCGERGFTQHGMN